MALVAMAIPIYTISTLIGREVITSAIKETANSAYGMVYSFIDHPEINFVLTNLDTKATLKRVENLIKSINTKDINETIHIILNQLHQVICEIVDDLSKINYSLNNYKKKMV